MVHVYMVHVKTILHTHMVQETQLSLTNRATRFEVSQGHRMLGMVSYLCDL